MNFRGKPWTNLERWTMFTFYKNDSNTDWYVRCAAEMEATRKDRVEGRPRGFYTPAKCKEEFDRIMSEPCPSDVPTGADYSRTAVVDAWIEYLAEEDQKDAELYDELMQIRLNNCEKHLAAVWGNRDAFTNEQLDEMLNDFKKELSEYEYDNEEEAAREELGKIYMKHLSAMFYAEKEKKLKAAQEARSPPQPREIVQPDRSLPSPAEEMEISTSAQPAPESVERVPVPVKKIEQPVSTTVEKMEVDEVETKPLDPVPEPPVIVTDAKRPRGRPPKKDASTPTREESPLHVEAKSPVRAEKTRRGSTRSDATPSPNTPGTSEKDIVDSPAGRVRGARRPVAVDSPLAKTTVRTSAGADVRETKESGRDGDGVKSRQSADALSRLSRAAAADDSGGKGAQTAVSVQMPLTGSDGESIPSRKSSRADRRSAAAAAAASTAVHSTPTSSQGLTTAVQTGEIKWEPEDMIVVGWPLSDAKMSLPSTSAYVVKTEQLLQRTEHVTSNQTSRLVSWDDVLNGSYEKKTSDSWKVQDPRLQMWDVCYCNFSDDALQAAREQALVHNHPETSNSFSLVASPPKRVRKEEKPSSATLTPKGRMMSAWNSLQEHRHSAVFLHPVTDRDAPGYSRLVYCPVDLTTVKREIDGGAITNPFVLMEKMFMMFTNAVMFNSTGHDVNFYAKEMFNATLVECVGTIDPRMDSFRVHNRRSRQGDDLRRRSSLTPTAQARTPMRKRVQ